MTKGIRMEFVTVRIRAELIPALEKLIETKKDEFGMLMFRSKTDAVTEAVKELLRKYSESKKEA